MNEHHRWVRFAVLGLAYALLGVALVVQEVAGPLALSWGIVLPGLLVLIGLLVVATAVFGNRRSRSA
jgi:cytochrome c oxidase subunit IV